MENLEIIDNYLMGRLNKQETIDFEERKSNNADFAKEVEEQKEIIDLVSVLEKNRLRRKFEKLEIEQINKKGIKRIYLIRTLSVAASVSIIFISYLTFFSDDFGQSKNELASNLEYVNEYLTPPINFFKQSTRGKSIEDKLSDAMLLYDNQKYLQATFLFDEIITPETTNVDILFFSGVSYVLSNQPEKAMTMFQKTEKMENPYNQEILWYKCLIYIDIDEKAKAIELLQQIIHSESKFKNDAVKILKKIN